MKNEAQYNKKERKGYYSHIISHDEKVMPIETELTPKSADTIFKSIQQRNYNEKVSKEAVLHHLKQLKAQMGKLKKQYKGFGVIEYAIADCMDMIDKKIAKINHIK